VTFCLVDVFSERPLAGNGLAVVFVDSSRDDLDTATLQGIAREFNQFETAFVYPPRDGAYPVRVFTVDEELPFAGHPLLGSAAMIHRRFLASGVSDAAIQVTLGSRTVRFASSAQICAGKPVYTETMNQGEPSFLGRVGEDHCSAVAAAVGLTVADLAPQYPLEIVSTGLPYLLIPLASGLERARIAHPDFEAFLSAFGAKFAYVFDVASLECRTWDNSGRVEDVATGSAAGPLIAYLVKNGFRSSGDRVILSQGRFVGRPSLIEGWLEAAEVIIKGDVALFAEGELSI